MIDLSKVQVIGDPKDVFSFPAKATLTQLGIVPGSLTLQVDHATQWPAVAIDESGAAVQSGTLWVILNINGQWCAAGAERLRPGQLSGDAKPEDADINNFIGVSWLYDANRWKQ